LPAILASLGNVIDKTKTPDADKAAAPVGKTKAKSQSDDATQANTPTAPGDPAAQLMLVAAQPVPAPVQAPIPATTPAVVPSAGGSDDDDLEIDASAPAATPSKAGPSGQGGAPLTSAPQADLPHIEAPQPGVPQTSLSPTAATPAGAKGTTANSALTDAADTAAAQQPGDDGDTGAQIDASTATAAMPAAPKVTAKPAPAGQGQDSTKTLKPESTGDNTVRAQQPDAPPPAQNAQPLSQPAQQTATNTVLNASGLIQPAAASTAASGGASAAPAIHVHVAPQDTMTPNVDMLAVQIAAKSQSGSRQFDIRLDPPELGRVDVRLSIDASGKAQAHLSADQQGTLDMLQKDAPTLTRALRDAGLDVSQGGLNFSLRGQGGNNAQGDGNGGQGGRRGLAMPMQAIKTVDPVAASWRGAADGRLDISV
jgi:flagellar hook-length control protein FliK